MDERSDERTVGLGLAGGAVVGPALVCITGLILWLGVGTCFGPALGQRGAERRGGARQARGDPDR